MGFEFNGETVGGGLLTGLSAIGSDLTLGLWDGGSNKEREGFGASKTFGYIDLAAIAIAGVLASGGTLLGAAGLVGGAKAAAEVVELAETEAGITAESLGAEGAEAEGLSSESQSALARANNPQWVQSGHNGLPTQGPANGTAARFNGGELRQIRFYDDEGNSLVGIDWGHDLGYGAPHYHVWGPGRDGGNSFP